MKNVVLFSFFLLLPCAAAFLHAEEPSSGSPDSSINSVPSVSAETGAGSSTDNAAPAGKNDTPETKSATAPEPASSPEKQPSAQPADTKSAQANNTEPAKESPAGNGGEKSDTADKTAVADNSRDKTSDSGIPVNENKENTAKEENTITKQDDLKNSSSTGSTSDTGSAEVSDNKTEITENIANSAGTGSPDSKADSAGSSSPAKAVPAKSSKSNTKTSASSAKSSAAAKNGKTETTAEKKQAEKTKPRKYTDDRWVLKISSEAVKEAVENKPAIRGVHITAWVAGSTPLRTQIINNIKKTVLNTVVIALKEMDGAVYIKGVEKAEKYKAYTGAIPNPEKMVEDFKKEGLYTVGRIVLFKDDILPVRRPDLSVKTPEGNIWRDRKGKTWADQYSKEVWDYNIAVALRAVEAGFDEIQFDYIRYPSEGKVSLCRYSVPHNWDKARANLAEFLRYAREKIPEQIRISADVFGLTTSARDDMGIGQNLPLIAQYADYVYPMMYPSHYYPGHYGLKNPNAEPYKVINFGLRDAMARLELNYAKLRPYLQDFSKYGPHEVGEQIRALRKNLLHSWVLWSPNNKYTWSALYPDYYKKNIDPNYVPDK